ncbi:TPA: cation transporter [Candidatus Marinimicrobia bacterium]|nr:MAG: Cation diffusion facilitator family transporter [Marinimicrobia bacterium 46_47]KUK90064.1 MAG: cation diffusion facilitator family transporter [Marinimicrobia bacterium 46_43]HAE86688.1 cation transporter [Candidatus Neomarinimicrobiota bacterium]HBY17625.1 cation transporter [Candidatus Neomarinimicrobiota bacterium]
MSNTRRKAITRAGYISIAGNLLLFVIKYWGGLVSGSVAIMADAWHTLSDSLSSLIVLMGARISSKPADKEHPFGHGRVELIAAILIGMMLVGVSWEFFTKAYENISSHTAVQYGWISIMVVSLSIISKELMAQYAFYISRKTESESVRADGWHHRSDALSSFIILVGIFVGPYVWWIDSLLTAIVALLILHSAYGIIRDASSRLIGNPPSPKTIEQVRKIGKKVCQKELNIHHIHIHEYGTHREMTLHIELPGEWTLDHGHGIADELEATIRKELDIEATVHIDPSN